VAIQPRSAPTSQPRAWWVANKPPTRRRSCLIAGHLEALATRRDNDEAAAIREFLIAWRRVEGSGATLMVRRNPKKSNQAIIFAMVPGVGAVKSVPIIIVPWHEQFTQIMRECGDVPFATFELEKVKPWGEHERRPPVVTEKVSVHLLPLR
jgi:hypothetical protein